MKLSCFLLVWLMFICMCDEKTTVEGYLQLFGSEPLPKIAVISEDHGRLLLDLTSQKRDSLWTNQKGPIRITGVIYEEKWMGRKQSFITMDKWEWVKDPG